MLWVFSSYGYISSGNLVISFGPNNIPNTLITRTWQFSFVESSPTLLNRFMLTSKRNLYIYLATCWRSWLIFDHLTPARRLTVRQLLREFRGHLLHSDILKADFAAFAAPPVGWSLRMKEMVIVGAELLLLQNNLPTVTRIGATSADMDGQEETA